MNSPAIKPRLTDIDLGEVLGLGAALVAPQNIGGRPFMPLPPGWGVADLSAHLPAPQRPTGTLALGSAASFIRYVKKHMDKAGDASAVYAPKTDGGTGTSEAAAPDADDRQTIILADIINSKFKAVFDHHASDAPGWNEHTATYDCPLSNQWKTWVAQNGRKNAMDQENFAFFLEQNILDVHQPNGATMLQIVTTLKSTKNVIFDSGLRLNDGQVQLKYHEENKTAAGQQGELQIPEKIKLGIPVYVGSTPYAVEAFFRYRIEGSRLMMWYDLITPDRILEDALQKVIAEIEAGTGIDVYEVVSTATR